MEIEILFTDKHGNSLGISDGVYFVRYSRNGYWESIPVENETEAWVYFNENVDE